MKKRSKLFTGIKFRPTAALFLEETEASLSVRRRRNFFPREEDRRVFQADSFPELLAQVGACLGPEPPGRLSIVLSNSFFLERTVFLPFRNRKAVSLVLPGELAPLLPSPLSEYFYDFTIPESKHIPITAFLLPASVYQSIAEAFPGVAFRIIPFDLALSRHPAVAILENALILAPGKHQARLVLFQKGRYALGRSFNFDEAGYRSRLAEEKELLLRSSRLPEIEPETVTPEEKISFGLSPASPGFTLKRGGQAAAPGKISLLSVALAGLVVLWILFFVSLKAKNTAFLSYQAANRELARQKEAAQVDGASLVSLFSDKNIALLIREDLSPLETFKGFNDAVPDRLPLVLDYLQIDRQKLVLNGTLGTPTQVDLLVKKLISSGRFEDIVLGELKLDGGSVKFPLTANIVAKKTK